MKVTLASADTPWLTHVYYCYRYEVYGMLELWNALVDQDYVGIKSSCSCRVLLVSEKKLCPTVFKCVQY